MIVYTYAKFGMNCCKNKWNITHCSECCVGSLLQYRYRTSFFLPRRGKNRVHVSDLYDNNWQLFWQKKSM